MFKTFIYFLASIGILGLMAIFFILGLAVGSKEKAEAIAQSLSSYSAAHPPQSVYNIDQDKLFDLIQMWRVANDYKPYKIDDGLCAFAIIRAFEVQNDWSHDGFVAGRIAPLSNHELYGENLAKEFFSEESMLDGWIHSPTHLENLESPFTYSCVRCINGYCAHEFGD